MEQERLVVESLRARLMIGLAGFCVIFWMVYLNWNGAVGEVSVSLLHWRVYSAGVFTYALIYFSVWALAPYWHALGRAPIWALAVSLSILFGLAVGTTDWQDWTMSRWWQFWWTVPIMAGGTSLIRRILSTKTPTSGNTSSVSEGQALPS